jgi:hypothetical protein
LSGDKAIWWSTAVAAAVVSHRHALEVVTRYGESGLTGTSQPGTVDGVV